MKMQDNKLKRFSIYGKIANTLFIIILALGVLALLVTLGTTFYLKSINYNLADAANNLSIVAFPDLEFSLPEDIYISPDLLFYFIILTALSLALTCYLIKSVANMFNNVVKDKTPFTQTLVKALKNMGIAMFIYVGVVFLVNLLSGTVIPHPFNMKFDITIDFKTILFGLLIYTLGEIFEFGMSLQQDSESIV